MKIETIELKNNNTGYYITILETIFDCLPEALEEYLKNKVKESWMVQSVTQLEDKTVVLFRKPIGSISSNE